MLDKKGNFYYLDCEKWDKNSKEGKPYPRVRECGCRALIQYHALIIL
jgi:hypothetical protein